MHVVFYRSLNLGHRGSPTKNQVPTQRIYRETLTFFDGGQAPEWTLPWTNKRGDVDIIYLADGVALGVIRKTNNTVGNPTTEIERATGGTATTRTRGSIERLVKTAASW
ncbi:MAG: hypothetical protein ACRCTR_07115 [Actinomycetota bacterium]